MLPALGLLARPLRHCMFVLLAFALVGMGSAQTRAHVLEHQTEAGSTRLYETQAIQSSAVVVRVARLKLGRKPYDHRGHRPGAPPLAVDRRHVPAASPTRRRSGPPAPPRAPPLQG